MWQKKIGPDGYARQGSHRVSRVVMRVFKNEEPTGKFVLHSCGPGRRACVNPAHLRLGSHEENMQDMVADNTSNRGERNNTTKLTNQEVLEIYRRVWAGETSAALAIEFGVSRCSIGNIKHGRAWAWLTGHTNGTKRAAIATKEVRRDSRIPHQPAQALPAATRTGSGTSKPASDPNPAHAATKVQAPRRPRRHPPRSGRSVRGAGPQAAPKKDG